jgi:TetR/AcrR family transcriptional regulator, transcriptional repressor for nem operon
MRYSAEHKQETRTRIVNAAGQLFRKDGYGGSGIDGLTKAAGVTNEAFYGHFKTKSEAFRTAVQAGLGELRTAIAALKGEQGKGWLTIFINYYLGPKRTCDLGDSCALPSLSADVMRADGKTRSDYEAELLRVVGEVSSGLPGSFADDREDRAIVLLALLSGGVTMARAVADPSVSERIADAVKKFALQMAERSQDKIKSRAK